MKTCYISDLLPVRELSEAVLDLGAGIETIRFSVAMNLDDFDRQLKEVRRELEMCGNPPLILHGPFLDLNPMSYDSRIRRVTKERFGQAYEAAMTLGASRIVYHSGMIPCTVYLEGWAERMADFWMEFLDGKSGIGICMENVFDRQYSGILEVAERVTHPDFGICLDIGHAHCYSPYPVLEWAKRLRGHIRHVHIHDNDGTWDYHRALGDGTIPPEPVLEELGRHNRDLTWTIECADRRDVLKSGRLLQKFLQEDGGAPHGRPDR